MHSELKAKKKENEITQVTDEEVKFYMGEKILNGNTAKCEIHLFENSKAANKRTNISQNVTLPQSNGKFCLNQLLLHKNELPFNTKFLRILENAALQSTSTS